LDALGPEVGAAQLDGIVMSSQYGLEATPTGEVGMTSNAAYVALGMRVSNPVGLSPRA
jgi:hypothetical protein